MKDETKRWIKLASDDLKSAEVNFNSKRYYVSVFLSHQTAEKALKSMMISKMGKFIKTHDLVILAQKVNAPENILEGCERLNNVYLDTRYGDIGGKPPSKKFNKKNSIEFLKQAKEILRWSKKNI